MRREGRDKGHTHNVRELKTDRQQGSMEREGEREAEKERAVNRVAKVQAQVVMLMLPC